MTEHDVYARIEKAVALAGSGRKWSKSLGLDNAYAARLRKGHVPLTPAFLAKLGLERVTTVSYRIKR